MLQDRLIDIAIDRFGRMGFDGASTRDIARASDTAMSSITYHFGGKEGLYLACADHIAAGIKERHQTGLELAADYDTLTREEAVERCLAIIDGFALTMLHPDSESWARFIVREQQAPTAAFERLYQGVMRTMIESFGNLLGRARPDLEPRRLRAFTMLIFGQALVLRAARASVLKALAVDEIGPDESLLLREQIRANSLAILSGGNE